MMNSYTHRTVVTSATALALMIGSAALVWSGFGPAKMSPAVDPKTREPSYWQ